MHLYIIWQNNFDNQSPIGIVTYSQYSEVRNWFIKSIAYKEYSLLIVLIIGLKALARLIATCQKKKSASVSYMIQATVLSLFQNLLVDTSKRTVVVKATGINQTAIIFFGAILVDTEIHSG
ncbi:hypothetical protein BDC45DRAFT_530839 [Circinella umbellata]|nr:hypothetical protein BDC45DRAFT_530839 [Circinella umbellata]